MIENLRMVGVAHAPTIAALHAPLFPDEPWSASAIAGILGSPGAFAHLLDDGAVPFGFAIARACAGEGEILAIGVDPRRRRAGAGRRLLRAAIDEAATRGAVELFLEVAEDNPAARALYLGCGFTAVGRRPAYYRRGVGPAVAAIVMRRSTVLS